MSAFRVVVLVLLLILKQIIGFAGVVVGDCFAVMVQIILHLILRLLPIFIPFFLGLQLAYSVKLLTPDAIQLPSYLFLLVFLTNMFDQLP